MVGVVPACPRVGTAALGGINVGLAIGEPDHGTTGAYSSIPPHLTNSHRSPNTTIIIDNITSFTSSSGAACRGSLRAHGFIFARQ